MGLKEWSIFRQNVMTNNDVEDFSSLETPLNHDGTDKDINSRSSSGDPRTFSTRMGITSSTLLEKSTDFAADPSGVRSGTFSTSTRPSGLLRGRQNESTTPYICNRSSSSSQTPGSSTTPFVGRSSSKTSGSRRTPYRSSTATPGLTPRPCSSSTIVAVVEGRGLAKGEIGMASVNLKKPELVLSQFSDMSTYVKTITMLQILHPLEIVLPSTACEGGSMTGLSKLITEQLVNASLATVQRKYFNESKGLLYVKQLCVPEFNSVELEVSTKYYCLAAAAALIKYVEFIQNIMYAPGSLKVVFKGSENTMMIDAATVRNLELLQNQRDPQSDHTLYGILNYTKTAGGARLLRSNILQPPSDLETITMRQNVVSELTEKEDIFYNLQAVISRFLDIDHILSLCVQVPKQENMKTAESKITNMIFLKHTLELVVTLREALGNCENPLLKASYKLLEDPRFSVILTKINCILHEDVSYQKGSLNMRTQKCFAVKPNINALLDIARKTYTEIVDDMTDVVNQMATSYNLPVKISYNTSRGFYMQMSAQGHTVASLPGIFIKVSKCKNTLSFTTADMIRMNDRVNESLHEIYIMTSIVMTELLNGIQDDIGCLYKLTETVSMLDMLLAFAHACTISDFVRPEFTDTLAIKQGRHPILERISVEPPVANNTYASEDSNFLVITGPNMSGKSTYLRQIALLQVMAQIGSFVPAEYASFRLTNQIFSRIGSDDDLETNSSTFTLEMREISYIIQTAVANSFIIIDELGRGTSAEEGVGLCYAICEFLQKLKAFTFFVTHFRELTSLDGLYPNVENYFFEIHRTFTSDVNCEKVHYTHILSKGKTEEKHYGIQLAEISTIPRSVVTEAKALAQKMSEERQNSHGPDPETCRQRAVFKLATRLVQAAHSSRLDTASLKQYLHSLRRKYEEEVLNLEE